MSTAHINCVLDYTHSCVCVAAWVPGRGPGGEHRAQEDTDYTPRSTRGELVSILYIYLYIYLSIFIYLVRTWTRRSRTAWTATPLTGWWSPGSTSSTAAVSPSGREYHRSCRGPPEQQDSQGSLLTHQFSNDADQNTQSISICNSSQFWRFIFLFCPLQKRQNVGRIDRFDVHGSTG